MEKLNCSAYDAAGSIEEMIKSGATVPVFISGNSMNPFLVNGRDIVYLKGFFEEELKTGKILLFKRNDNQLILHRLHSVLPDGMLQVVGDGQTVCETIDKAQVIAVVSEIERKGKRRSADSFGWKAVSCLWRMLIPVRSLMMRVWRKCRRIKNKI